MIKDHIVGETGGQIAEEIQQISLTSIGKKASLIAHNYFFPQKSLLAVR